MRILTGNHPDYEQHLTDAIVLDGPTISEDVDGRAVLQGAARTVVSEVLAVHSSIDPNDNEVTGTYSSYEHNWADIGSGSGFGSTTVEWHLGTELTISSQRIQIGEDGIYTVAASIEYFYGNAFRITVDDGILPPLISTQFIRNTDWAFGTQISGDMLLRGGQALHVLFEIWASSAAPISFFAPRVLILKVAPIPDGVL